MVGGGRRYYCRSYLFVGVCLLIESEFQEFNHEDVVNNPAFSKIMFGSAIEALKDPSELEEFRLC
jgi:hypothetical protein